ncbi:MAG TPA: hypothetical protein VGZ23_18240 [bacterium]|nr:hypothetical protein [bacterium]
MKLDYDRVLSEFRAAYAALRRAADQNAGGSLPYVAVLERPDLRTRRGAGVWLSRCAAPAASVEFARMRAAWEMLPAAARTKAHLILGVQRAR